MKNKVLLIVLLFFAYPVFLFAGDCEKAIEYYNEGVNETDSTIKEAKYLLALHEGCDDPEITSKIYNNLADTYENRGELTRAIRYYNESIISKSDYAKPYFGIADIMFGLEDYYSAYIMYKKGLDLDPGDELSQKNIKESQEKYKKHMRVYFYTGSYEVNEDYLFRLDMIADVMKEDEEARYLIIGHTDDVGSESFNMDLSKKRAEWINDYLMNKGIESDSIKIEFKGENNPLVSNDDEDGRTLNRRTDIKVSM